LGVATRLALKIAVQADAEDRLDERGVGDEQVGEQQGREAA
jgi:hypothetical protein